MSLPGRSKVALSPHRAEYEDLRFNKHFTLREIAQYARNKYGEHFSIPSLSKYFSKHEKYLEASIKSNKLRKKLLKERIEQELEATTLIIRQLRDLSNQLSKVENNLDDPEARKETREIIRIADAVLNTALRYKDELSIEDTKSEEEIYDRLRYAIEELPPLQQRKVLKRFEEYESGKQ